MTRQTSKTQKPEPILKGSGSTQVEKLISFTERSMRDYGIEVVEKRAIPDFRDGLKPVHRCILWAMYKLGLHHTAQFKKAARTVGETIAKYHPHGDQSTYQAMVGMAGVRNDTGEYISRNSCVPLVDGYGNWGDNTSDAAAMRYTESRLSKFADLMMLDPDYVAVMPTVPNFSEDEQMPLVLPAKLPVGLLNGSSSIAVGIAASCPAFEVKGIVEVLKTMLVTNKPLDLKYATRTLKFSFPYGGVCVSPLKDIAHVLKTGTGSLLFRPEFEFNASKKEFAVTSACPNFVSPGSIQSTFDKIAALKGVASVVDESGKNKTRYVVKLQRTYEDATIKKIESLLTKSDRYDIGMTVRSISGRAKFKRVSVLSMLEEWLKWRVILEIKVLNRLISVANEKLFKLRTMVLAIDNLQTIIAALKVEDSAAFLMKKLRITKEQADMILDMKVRQLKSLEKKTLIEKIRVLEVEVRTLTKELKTPKKRIHSQLSELKI